MKSILVILLMLFSFYDLRAQEVVKSIKALELNQYIQNSSKAQIINFWASWCAPCMEEMPFLQEIARRYPDSIELVLVSLDFKAAFPGKLNSFISDRKMVGTHFWLDETDADYFCPLIDSSWSGSIPATVLINRKTGYRNFFEKQLSEAELDKLLKEIMK